ncbi:unnamed protein product, partial [Rotaria magnacalcarata]
RKHTNSASSTRSSISEYSLTKFNSNDSNQTQQMTLPTSFSSSNKRTKSVRKRIDDDGLTKVP